MELKAIANETRRLTLKLNNSVWDAKIITNNVMLSGRNHILRGTSYIHKSMKQSKS